MFVSNQDQSVAWDSNKVRIIIDNGIDGLIASTCKPDKNQMELCKNSCRQSCRGCRKESNIQTEQQ